MTGESSSAERRTFWQVLRDWLPSPAKVAAVVVPFVIGASVAILSDRNRTPPPIVRFSATPTVVKAGDTVLLSWETKYVRTLRIDPVVGWVEPNAGLSIDQGSRRVQVAETTEFSATGVGSGGKDSVSTKVEVITPLPASTQPPRPLARKGAQQAKAVGSELATGTALPQGHRRFFDVSWNCEETVSASVDEPITIDTDHEGFALRWEVTEISNAKVSDLPQPQLGLKRILARYSFTGLDRVWYRCPGRGRARFTLVLIPASALPPAERSLIPDKPTNIRIVPAPPGRAVVY